MASGGAATRSGSMIGSFGVPFWRKATPLMRMSRCSRSVRPPSVKMVVELATVTGAGNPGASKVTVSVPLEVSVRTAAAWRAAAA